MSSSSTAAGGSSAAPEKTKKTSSALAILQRIGRSLMMPIAVLPAAAILLRLGQPDLLGAIPGLESTSEVIGQAGNALFESMPLLFAIGVAIGFAKKADGSTALAALVGYLVFDRVTKLMFFNAGGEIGARVTLELADGTTAVNWGAKNPTDVLGGILIGIVAALLWQRFYRIKLPTWLGFFGGRRFVPIITAVTALLLGVVFGFLWPTIGGWINGLGEWIIGSGAVGAGVYGMVNRLLLPFGLHHIVNSVVWFVFGSFEGPDGVVHGEINRYLAGDPTAGGFLSGFFPVLMFGLPAAALAMWRAARPGQRAAVGGIMISAALTAFVTGITEPIEYAFIFIAPVLFVLHIVLTGISMAVLNALDAHLGFGFSAGLIDLLLNATKDNTTGLGLILLLGLVYFALYYVVFYFAITKLNLPTPGREPEQEKVTADVPSETGGDTKETKTDTP
ncbi:PTS transporter subunit EIIC [Marinactinospora thermotolerans]|uniref:PTS system, N-acetylglucosamine-specific IIC component n=1 Tax=Marinactinospora thermotolerans DSM 45154 TaxID=1122192 RepID=A0A1T4QJ99_9ACTN|nr:PTS transporter subunit EIIC [Marinactinospora thermotolerans]SKA03764.1 PTS system, N-acetylglucosamine-specific IIC component [Marinactinospora thermotolerans DSM 45154]